MFACVLARLLLVKTNVPLTPGSPMKSSQQPSLPAGNAGRTRVAVVSFLFNWPSTGGGIIHTVELATFLQRAGYDVQLIAPHYRPWRIGLVESDCPFPATLVPFEDSEWNVPDIGRKLRSAVNDFAPESVIVTDAWNIKPHLFAALSDYRVFLRMQAQECLCPLNNLRLRPGRQGFEPCPFEQLGGPDDCIRCLVKNEAASGGLHRLERRLSGVGSDVYRDRLQRAFREADAVLVLNPTVANVFRPYCGRVEVVTWGMDGDRFPAPSGGAERLSAQDGKRRFLFAGLVREAIKGAHVLRAAGRRVWTRRQDFELVFTDLADEDPAPFEQYIGWQSQTALPKWYRRTDLTVVPTVAPDGLSRTSVEAMASGRPVVASRIGGLPFTVSDGETGLLFEPGDVGDLAAKLDRLLDDPALCSRMGTAGREHFERRFTWERVIETSYRPLLDERGGSTAPGSGATSLDGRSVAAPGPSTRTPPSRDAPIPDFGGLVDAFAAVARTPGQMTAEQYFRVAVEILQRAPCRLLIFGGGRDTQLWVRANRGGRTLVLEDNPEWRSVAGNAGAEVLSIRYTTRTADGFLTRCPAAEGVPTAVDSASWDVVLVDGPAGWNSQSPGRQQSILLASRAVASDGVVFLHDAQRDMERRSAESYLKPPDERHGTQSQLAVFRYGETPAGNDRPESHSAAASCRPGPLVPLDNN